MKEQHKPKPPIRMMLDLGISLEQPEMASSDIKEFLNRCRDFASQFGETVSSGIGWGIRDQQIELPELLDEDGQEKLLRDVQETTNLDTNSYASIYVEDARGFQVARNEQNEWYYEDQNWLIEEGMLDD